MSYKAPVDDILLALKSAAGLDRQLADATRPGLDEGTIRSIIEEAGRLGCEVLAPLNRIGDKTGCQRTPDGQVTTPPGWTAAYRAFVDGGWSTLPCPERYGGQGLPEIVSTAVGEVWNAANLSFGLCPLLTQGAIHALAIGGSDDLKARYLPRLVSGEWAGTMNLTEPQAGSDLGEIRTRAVPQADGSFRLFGTKIFITYGEHDLTDNIIHLVLARLPDAPSGTRGISLFLVPKVLVKADGSMGVRNDVVCAGLEEKLGIHASPTCVMSFGEKDGAVGYLVGEPNRGLNTMFIMMNAARLAVGVQGVAIADRATQHAIRYASERRQGRPAGGGGDTAGPAPIVIHADVRRMLLEMRAKTAAARMLCFATACALDDAGAATEASARESAANRAALLTPVAKAFSTDIACEVASLGVQIHGGMGFVEETGAAQFYRDARILPIYEGTNGIQAIDLVTRKLPLAGGETMRGYLDDLEDMLAEVEAAGRPELRRTAERIGAALAALAEASDWMGRALTRKPEAALAGATPFLRLFGLAAGGCYLARAVLLADDEPGDPAATIAMARYFAEHLATAAPGLALTVMDGAGAILDCPAEVLSP